MKALLLAVVVGAAALPAQQDPLEGLWQGYDAEWGHVSRQLVALAEAIPPATYAWRPGTGVRWTSEVFMHIAMTNFYLLSVTGPKMPADMTSRGHGEDGDCEGGRGEVAEALAGGRQSGSRRGEAADLTRRVKIEGRDATVDGMYLRIIVHANEHMGQLVAYARMNGIVPPWSEGGGK